MEPVRGKRGVLTWRCDGCGRLFWWDEAEAPAYFGSVKATDDCDWEKIQVVCSDACRKLLPKRKTGRCDR